MGNLPQVFKYSAVRKLRNIRQTSSFWLHIGFSPLSECQRVTVMVTDMIITKRFLL